MAAIFPFVAEAMAGCKQERRKDKTDAMSRFRDAGQQPMDVKFARG